MAPTTTSCSITMSELYSSPYNLVEGDLIVAVVEAIIRSSTQFPVNLTLKVLLFVQVIPHDPVLPPVRVSDTTESSVHFTIPTLTANGGAAITSYGVEINDGSGF